MKDLVGPADFSINNCGTAKVVKEDDAGNRINGVKFELFTDVGVLGTFEEGIDNVAANEVGECITAGTDSNGDPLGECSIENVPIGTYWLVEDVTTVPDEYDPADPKFQKVEITAAGDTVTGTFTNPRRHKVIVLVCHEGTNTLAPSDVFDVSGDPPKTTLAAPPGDLTEAELCGLEGATYEHLSHGNKGFRVDVGSDAHPPPSP